MTHLELKTAIAGWINHSAVTGVMSTLVTLAEAQLRRDVRVSAMESLVTGSLSGGSVALPSRFVDARRLLVDGHVYNYITPEHYQDELDANSQERLFTVMGGSIYAVAASTEAYSLLCHRWFEPLSGDSDTNWVLTNASDVYLWQGLKQAAIYMKDAAAAQGYEALYQQSLASMNSMDKAGRTAGTLTIRSRGWRA